jgi:hypothetical protein
VILGSAAAIVDVSVRIPKNANTLCLLGVYSWTMPPYVLSVSPRCRPPSIWYRLYRKAGADRLRCFGDVAIRRSGKIS